MVMMRGFASSSLTLICARRFRFFFEHQAEDYRPFPKEEIGRHRCSSMPRPRSKAPLFAGEGYSGEARRRADAADLQVHAPDAAQWPRADTFVRKSEAWPIKPERDGQRCEILENTEI